MRRTTAILPLPPLGDEAARDAVGHEGPGHVRRHGDVNHVVAVVAVGKAFHEERAPGAGEQEVPWPGRLLLAARSGNADGTALDEPQHGQVDAVLANVPQGAPEREARA